MYQTVKQNHSLYISYALANLTVLKIICYILFKTRHNRVFLCCLRGPRCLSRYSDSLQAGRSGDRIPAGARFSAPVQTGPGAHPAFYTMGTGSFPGIKRPGRGVDNPPPSSAEVKERVELHLSSPLGLCGLL